MQKLIATASLWLAITITGYAYGQTATEAAPAKPRVYALIAALGEQFTLIQQKPMIGTHFAPYETKTVKVEGNALNRSVLVGLNDAIAGTDPTSKRLFYTLPAANMNQVKAYEKESVAIGDVVAVLETMPDRQTWDSIVVATPAFKNSELDGVGGRIAGFGVFYQGLSGNVSSFFNGVADFDEVGGQDATTPEGKFTRNKRYTAPFSFIEIWVLDPKTLKVLDRQRRYDNLKLFDPLAGGNITSNIDQTVLMKNVASLIERSISAAVTHSDLLKHRGVVDVGNVKEALPEGAKK